MSDKGGYTISVESQWFKIGVFASSAVAAGVTLANIIYYAKLRKDKGMTAIKPKNATTMMWINIALFVVSLLVLLWSVWMLLFSRPKRTQQLATVTQPFLSHSAGAIPTPLAPAAHSTLPAPQMLITSPESTTSAVLNPAAAPVGQPRPAQTVSVTVTPQTRAGN